MSYFFLSSLISILVCSRLNKREGELYLYLLIYIYIYIYLIRFSVEVNGFTLYKKMSMLKIFKL